jgi:hypothetical protein
LRPSFLVYTQKVRTLEAERNQLVHNLQSSKIIVRDALAIERNAQGVQTSVSHKVYTSDELKAIVAQTIRKHTALVFQSDWNTSQTIDYGAVAAIPLTIKVNIVPAKAAPLLTDLLAIGFGQIQSVEYINQVMTIEIIYVYTKKKTGRKLSVKKQSGNSNFAQKAYPRIQGFFMSGQKIGVICHNRIYRVGEKCGNYVILKIQPALRQVVFGYQGRAITVRK